MLYIWVMGLLSLVWTGWELKHDRVPHRHICSENAYNVKYFLELVFILYDSSKSFRSTNLKYVPLPMENLTMLRC